MGPRGPGAGRACHASSSSASSRFGLCAPKSNPPLPSAALQGPSDKRQPQDLSLSEAWSGSGWASTARRVSLPQGNAEHMRERERAYRELTWGVEGGADARGVESVRAVRGGDGAAWTWYSTYVRGPAGALRQHGHGRAVHTVLIGHQKAYGALS